MLLDTGLTEALRILTEGTTQEGPPASKFRGSAPKVISSALPPGGSAPAGGGSTFTARGTKTMATSDGLFTMYYPETLETVIGPTTYTLGVVKKVTV